MAPRSACTPGSVSIAAPQPGAHSPTARLPAETSAQPSVLRVQEGPAALAASPQILLSRHEAHRVEHPLHRPPEPLHHFISFQQGLFRTQSPPAHPIPWLQLPSKWQRQRRGLCNPCKPLGSAQSVQLWSCAELCGVPDAPNVRAVPGCPVVPVPPPPQMGRVLPAGHRSGAVAPHRAAFLLLPPPLWQDEQPRPAPHLNPPLPRPGG